MQLRPETMNEDTEAAIRKLTQVVRETKDTKLADNLAIVMIYSLIRDWHEYLSEGGRPKIPVPALPQATETDRELGD
jgi:hypothetical protein